MNIKQKRLGILKQINRLDSYRCQKCSGQLDHTGDIICHCPAAVEIRKLGNQLMALTREAKADRIQAMIQEVKDNGLTVEKYFSLREAEVQAKEIQKISGMTQKGFYEWKHENGMIGLRSGAGKSQHETDISYQEQASRNGINRMTFWRRVESGWSDWDAANIPAGITRKQYYKQKETVK